VIETICNLRFAICDLQLLGGGVNEKELLARTKQFALRVMTLVGKLPGTVGARSIGAQLVRSGTSVGANYRAACRGRSKAEFIAKLGTVEEEADESAFWLELIIEGHLMDERLVHSLLDEAGQLTRIMAASRQSARRNLPIANRKSQIANQ
jgi:four helix bundle protein